MIETVAFSCQKKQIKWLFWQTEERKSPEKEAETKDRNLEGYFIGEKQQLEWQCQKLKKIKRVRRPFNCFNIVYFNILFYKSLMNKINIEFILFPLLSFPLYHTKHTHNHKSVFIEINM